MLKLNEEKRAFLKKAWIWVLIIVASVSVWTIVFYWASQPLSSETLVVWVGAEANLNNELKEKIQDVALKNGMKESSVNSYDPANEYYSAAFAMQTMTVDIYVLKQDEALSMCQSLAETGAYIFKELNEDYAALRQVLIYEDTPVGVQFFNEYYVFVNYYSNKPQELLFEAVSTIVEYGAEHSIDEK